MAWYFIFFNFLFVAIVVSGIVGLHAWAIATQDRDCAGWQRDTATTEAIPAPAAIAQLAAEPALS